MTIFLTTSNFEEFKNFLDFFLLMSQFLGRGILEHFNTNVTQVIEPHVLIQKLEWEGGGEPSNENQISQDVLRNRFRKFQRKKSGEKDWKIFARLQVRRLDFLVWKSVIK